MSGRRVRSGRQPPDEGGCLRLSDARSHAGHKSRFVGDDELRTVADLKLREHLGEMRPDCGKAHLQLRGEIRVAGPSARRADNCV